MEYPKIETLFNRDIEGTKKLIIGSFRNPIVEYLQFNRWFFTEKIDGTNIRVIWDGHTVTFKGRTEKADIYPPLLEYLQQTFGDEATAQLFEQNFGETPAIFYGEGYGGAIQKNGRLYSETPAFILFDIMCNKIFLERVMVEFYADMFGIKSVPILFKGNLHEAVSYIYSQPKSVVAAGKRKMEGIVGLPELVRIYDPLGHRIIIKLKVKDFI